MREVVLGAVRAVATGAEEMVAEEMVEAAMVEAAWGAVETAVVAKAEARVATAGEGAAVVV